MEIITLTILFILGIGAGLYAGNVGGGSFVVFPALIFAGLPTPTAIATNRLSAVFVEVSSSIKFYKEKIGNVKLSLILGFIAAVGAYIGSHIVLTFSEQYLDLVIAIVLLMLLVILNYKETIIKKEQVISHKHKLMVCGGTFILGIYGGFFGAGFGTLMMMILILLDFSLFESAATARLIGFFMSMTAVIVFAMKGLINYPYALTTGFGSAIGSWIGISIAIKKGNKYIKTLFTIIIIITIIKLILNFFNIKIL